MVARLRLQLEAFAVGQWNAMESWRDADVARFEDRVLPVALASQRQVASLTNATLAADRNLALGTNDRTPRLDVAAVTGEALRGVDPREVYARPQVTMNTALSRGANVTQAVTQAGERLRSIVTTDLQLARTKTLQAQGQASFYRRTLTGAENCGVCTIASTQRYRKRTLMPIHPGCDCGIEEIQGSVPHVLDPVKLETVHAAIAAEFGDSDRYARYIDGRGQVNDYLDLIVVSNHGEYGPTLRWRDQHFTGPRAVA